MANKGASTGRKDGIKGRILTEKDREADLPVRKGDKMNVEVGWTVKALSGEVDMDASCLLFNKWGRYVETIFWDNLSANGIRHLGDEAISANEDDEEEDQAKEEEEKEVIEVDFGKLEDEITTLVFGMNIFSNKTFSSVTNISFTVSIGGQAEPIKYRIPGIQLQKLKDFNAVVLAKIFRTSLQEQTWKVRVLVDTEQKTSAHSLPFGQVMDVLIPHLVHSRQVEALVPTWSKVKVQVLEGRGLAAEDLNGKSDPYVVIKTGTDWQRRTSYKKSTLTPKWDDAIYEFDYDMSYTVIGFDVYDYDRIGKDEFLGRFSVSIAALPPNKETVRWYSLKSRHKDGEVGDSDALGSLCVRLLKLSPTD